MAAPLKTYDPGQVSVILGGKIMSGFSEGSLIKVSRNVDAYTLKIGTDGEGVRTRLRDKSGKIEIMLMQSSDSNDILSAYALADEANNSGTIPFLMRDASGRTVVSAATAWVKKISDVEMGKEVKDHTWVLETDELDMFVGGN